MKKNKVIKIMIISVFVISNIYLYYKEYNINNNIIAMNGKIDTSNMISIMLETSDGTYSKSSDNTWPDSGYVFNYELSSCENGGKLDYDSTSKKVTMENSSSDKCYLYFSKGYETLANHIIGLFTGVQGENNLYYHNYLLRNGANDNSYRYAGSNDTTNNWVCFDSDEETCPDDNLYRIIGVFKNNDDEYEVKLIKSDVASSNLLGTDGDFLINKSYDEYDVDSTKYHGSKTSFDCYGWNYTNAESTYQKYGYYSIWSESTLNTVNLNTNFINNIGTKWSSMIATHNWIVQGNSTDTIRTATAPTIYQNEIVSPSTEIVSSKYSAKIGLIYVSDYAYSAAPTAWEKILRSSDENAGDDYSDKNVTSVNWMYVGLAFHTITPDLVNDHAVMYVTLEGCIEHCPTTDFSKWDARYAERPSFYLSSTTNYVSGDGTKENSFRIS